MKIVQIGDYPENENYIKGGVQASIYGLVKELIIKKNNVCVISYPGSSILSDHYEKRNNLEVFYFKKFGVSGILRILTIIKTINNIHPEICHLHGSNLVNLLVYIYTKLAKIPSLLTLHGIAFIEKRNDYNKDKTIRNLLKYIERRSIDFVLFNISQLILVDTQYVADALVKLYKKNFIFRNPKYYVIPQGIDEEYFKLADNYEIFKIMTIGAICKRKGYIDLIQAMEKVICLYPKIILNIIGSLADHEYYQEIKNYINKKNLLMNIYIYPDLSFYEMKEYLSKSNIFVLHSEEESQGIVLCEAMACGKPIVATKIGGIPYIIKESVNGFLSDYSNIDQFAENIIRIIKDSTLRNKLSCNNRITAKQYSWKIIVDKIEGLYNDCVA